MNKSLVDHILYMQDKFIEFIDHIQKEHDIPDEVLREILARQEFRDFFADTKPLIQAANSRTGRSAVKKDSKPREEPAGECMAELKSGIRKGEVCGKKICNKSNTGKYCGVHVKLENTPEALKKSEDEELDGVIFVKNKHGNFTFGETGLILKSELVKKIIGKQLPDGKIIDLNDDDIALCRLRQLRFVRNYNLKASEISEKVPVAGTNTIEHTSQIPLI